MSKTFLSIIIPIYKVEKYISGTLTSIFCNPFPEEEYEVVIVNDATPDLSMRIVKEFASRHTNIRIIDKEKNEGLSLARNSGLKVARGSYIWFVDSDDQISDDSLFFLNKLTQAHPDIDLFGFDMIKVNEESGKQELSPIVQERQKQLYNTPQKNTIVCPNLQGPVQRFIYRKDFLEIHKIEFCPHLLHEDMEFLPRVYYFADTVYLSNHPIYRYLLRTSGSITSSLPQQSYPDRIRIIEMLRSYKIQDSFHKEQNLMLDLYVFWIAFFLLSPDKYTIIHPDDFLTFIKANSSEIRKAARSGIKALWHYNELKRIPLAIILFASPLSIYQIYYGKEIKNKKELLENGETTQS